MTNETNRHILRPMLENWGMLATIVASGAEGIKEMLGSMCSGRPFARLTRRDAQNGRLHGPGFAYRNFFQSLIFATLLAEFVIA
jgi:hypothetical protein